LQSTFRRIVAVFKTRVRLSLGGLVRAGSRGFLPFDRGLLDAQCNISEFEKAAAVWGPAGTVFPGTFPRRPFQAISWSDPKVFGEFGFLVILAWHGFAYYPVFLLALPVKMRLSPESAAPARQANLGRRINGRDSKFRLRSQNGSVVYWHNSALSQGVTSG